MLLDHELVVADSQDLGAAGAGTHESTNGIDMGAAKNVAGGAKIQPYCIVTEAFAGTAPTLQVQVVAADNAALTTNPLILAVGPSHAAAALGLGAKVAVPKPTSIPTNKRYLGMRFVVGGTPSAGMVLAGFACDEETAPGTLETPVAPLA